MLLATHVTIDREVRTLDLETGHKHFLSAGQFGWVFNIRYSLTPPNNLEVRRYSHLTNEEMET